MKPRALHRTTSVFLRNLAPAITKSELETVSKFLINNTLLILFCNALKKIVFFLDM